MNINKYIGIDVHKATSVFATRNHKGKLLSEGIFETNSDTIVDFLKGQRGTVWVTFEEGTFADWLYEVIKPHVAKVVVCDPRKNKQDGSKADRIDAKKLAELLRTNSLTAVYHGGHSTRTLKELARSYENLRQDSTRVMNRVKAIFRGRGIACQGESLYQAKDRQQWLAKLDNHGSRRRAERLLHELDSLVQLRAEAQADMIRESRKHKGYKILRSIPGLGPVRVALILAIVMTPHRFRTKRQFWTYAGLSVVTRISGEYEIIDGQVRRSKRKPLPRGLNRNYNHVLKHVFKGAALTAAYRGPFQEEYERRIAKGTSPNLVLLTLARKISAITLTLWKKGEMFDIKKHRLNEQTT
jgi:transposase